MSSAKRNSSRISVCSLDLACNRLRLKSFPSKRYIKGLPLSPSWKATVSMAENIMLNRDGVRKQPCLAPFVTGNGSENSPSFWTRASIPSWNCLSIAMNLVGQPNFAIIFQRPAWLTVSHSLVRSTKINKTCRGPCSVPGISLEPGLLWKSCQLFLCPFWIYTGFQVEALTVQVVHLVG